MQVTKLINICPPLSLTKISPLPPPHLLCLWSLPPSHLLMLSLPSSPICLNITNPPGIPFPLFDSLPVSQLGFPLLSENKMIKTNVCDGESNMHTIVNEFPQTFFFFLQCTHTQEYRNCFLSYQAES